MRTRRLIYYGKLPGLNEIIGAARRNPYSEASMRRKWEKVLMQQWSVQGVKKGQTAKVKAEILYYEPNARRDEDNVKGGGNKYIMDALKKAGYITDDSQKHFHIAHDEVFVDRKNPRVEVILSEAKK